MPAGVSNHKYFISSNLLVVYEKINSNNNGYSSIGHIMDDNRRSKHLLVSQYTMSYPLRHSRWTQPSAIWCLAYYCSRNCLCFRQDNPAIAGYNTIICELSLDPTNLYSEKNPMQTYRTLFPTPFNLRNLLSSLRGRKLWQIKCLFCPTAALQHQQPTVQQSFMTLRYRASLYFGDIKGYVCQTSTDCNIIIRSPSVNHCQLV